MIGVGHLLASQNSRPDRLDDEALDGRVMLFKGDGAASEGAGCPKEIAKNADVPSCLAEYFLRRM
jgi:hypothetical protein